MSGSPRRQDQDPATPPASGAEVRAHFARLNAEAAAVKEGKLVRLEEWRRRRSQGSPLRAATWPSPGVIRGIATVEALAAVLEGR